MNGQNLIFSTFLGSHGTDDGNAIALDAMDNIYVTGDTNSDQFPVTSGAVQPNRKAGFDVIISELSPNGAQLQYSTFLGGSGDDSGSGVSVDRVRQHLCNRADLFVRLSGYIERGASYSGRRRYGCDIREDRIRIRPTSTDGTR